MQSPISCTFSQDNELTLICSFIFAFQPNLVLLVFNNQVFTNVPWSHSFEFCRFMGFFWVLWKDYVVALYCLWFLFIVSFWWFLVFVICAFSSLLSMLSLDVHCLLLPVLLSLISSCCIFHLFSPSLITCIFIDLTLSSPFVVFAHFAPYIFVPCFLVFTFPVSCFCVSSNTPVLWVNTVSQSLAFASTTCKSWQN